MTHWTQLVIRVKFPVTHLLSIENANLRNLGCLKNFFGSGMNDEVRKAVDEAIAFYSSKGFEMIELSLPSTELSIPVYYVIATAEASSNLARYDGIRYTSRSPRAENAIDLYSKSRGEGFGEEVKKKMHSWSICSQQRLLRCLLFTSPKNPNFNKKRLRESFRTSGCDFD